MRCDENYAKLETNQSRICVRASYTCLCLCPVSRVCVPCPVSYVRVMFVSCVYVRASYTYLCLCHMFVSRVMCHMSVSCLYPMYVSVSCPCLPFPKTWRWIKCANNICWDKSKNKMKKVYHFNYGWVYHFILTFQMGKFNLSNLGGDLMPEKSTDAMNTI